MLRILIADDHAILRRQVRYVLEAEEGWQVCGEATTGREAVEMAIVLKPDLVVLDLSMPELNGLAAAQQILEKSPHTNVIILTVHESEDLHRAARVAGARACLTKTEMHCLPAEVHALLLHDPPQLEPASSLQGAPQHISAAEEFENGDPNLSVDEQAVLRLLALSKSNKEIATALSVSLEIVQTRRVAMMRKLNIDAAVDLVHYAIRTTL